jgi:hypothetical protein
MPTLESNLLYQTAKLILRRAGTPGRAPWNWQAVVIFMAAALSFGSQPVRAQSLQIRLGAFGATPLVKDEVSSFAVDSAIAGRRSQGITVQQQIGPIGTIALHLAMRGRTEIEVNGSVARSAIQGDDRLQTWDAGNVTIANAVIGIGYRYRRIATIHASVGGTKLIADDQGMFSRGNSIRPVIELGLSRNIGPVDLDIRAQSHGFGTATLRDNGSSDGNVTRLIAQIGTTVWKRGAK